MFPKIRKSRQAPWPRLWQRAPVSAWARRSHCTLPLLERSCFERCVGSSLEFGFFTCYYFPSWSFSFHPCSPLSVSSGLSSTQDRLDTACEMTTLIFQWWTSFQIHNMACYWLALIWEGPLFVEVHSFDRCCLSLGSNNALCLWRFIVFRITNYSIVKCNLQLIRTMHFWYVPEAGRSSPEFTE